MVKVLTVREYHRLVERAAAAGRAPRGGVPGADQVPLWLPRPIPAGVMATPPEPISPPFVAPTRHGRPIPRETSPPPVARFQPETGPSPHTAVGTPAILILDPESLQIVEDDRIRVGLPTFDRVERRGGDPVLAWRTRRGGIHVKIGDQYTFDWTATWGGSRYLAASDPVLVEQRLPGDVVLAYTTVEGDVVVSSAAERRILTMSDLRHLVTWGAAGHERWLIGEGFVPAGPIPRASGKPALAIGHQIGGDTHERRLYLFYRATDGRLIVAYSGLEDVMDVRNWRASHVATPVPLSSDPVAIYSHFHVPDHEDPGQMHRSSQFVRGADRVSVAFRGTDGHLWLGSWRGHHRPVSWENLTASTGATVPSRLPRGLPAHQLTTGQPVISQWRLARDDVDALTIITCPTTVGVPLVFLQLYDQSWGFTSTVLQRWHAWRVAAPTHESRDGRPAPPATTDSIAAFVDWRRQEVSILYRGAESDLHQLTSRIVFFDAEAGQRRGRPTFLPWVHRNVTEELFLVNVARGRELFQPSAAPGAYRDEAWDRVWDIEMDSEVFDMGRLHTFARNRTNFTKLFVPYVPRARDISVVIADEAIQGDQSWDFREVT